ncbi:MAG TPA: Xaa-Pro peptidase family protein [Tetragenococcus sp.]|nr:Xaa-Pro peptidase family protein [Tetragenococcus sp.]
MSETEEKLIAYLEKKNLDAYFIQKKVNVRYISGYTGEDSFLLITKDHKKYFITDYRYTEQAAIECPDYELIVWRTPGRTLGDSLFDLSEKNHLSTIGFEGDELSFENYTDVSSKTPEVEWVDHSGVIEKMREIKTPEEISYLRAACDIACRAYERLLEDIHVGVTEKELAAKLAAYMVFEGADTQPYGNILISGARTSLLHGIPSEKAIEYGDFVLMDFGCQFNGYLSDMTRTVVVGKASEKQKEVYELEKQSLEDSLAMMKAGRPVRDIYRASIQSIKDTEYLKYNYNNIGHGIGLFVHELPYTGEQYDDILEAGNVRTIEPGIYVPNWGGVRIEDQILITEDGYENMISTSHELLEL